MNVVADTNVLVSAVISRTGPAATFLDLWRHDRFTPLLRTPQEMLRSFGPGVTGFTLVTSPFLLKEVEAVLDREKIWKTYGLSRSDRRIIVDIIRRFSRVVYPVTIPAVIPEDPSDDHILATAVEGNASLVVSGDRHLLRLQSHHGIKIVSLTEFLKKRRYT